MKDSIRRYKDRQAEYVVIGSGPGGATVAATLASKGKNVLILEKGTALNQTVFYKNQSDIKTVAYKILRKSLNARPISKHITMRCRVGIGGTSTVSSANAVRGWEKCLNSYGINIDSEFKLLEEEHDVQPFPEHLMGRAALMLWEAADSLGIKMKAMPKMVDFNRCKLCGNCSQGCINDAKWSAEKYISSARNDGARLLTGISAVQINSNNGKTTGVEAIDANKERHSIEAKVVIVSAGSLETPILLNRSGLKTAGKKLFCHPFHVVYGPTQNESLYKEPRSIISTQFLDEPGFMFSNYVVAPIQKNASMGNCLGIIVKIRDENRGEVLASGNVNKKYTREDIEKTQSSIKIAKDMLTKAGVQRRSVRIRFHSALHAGGTAAIGDIVDSNLETKIENCFVADASVLPEATAMPPILTIMALSRRLAKYLLNN